MPVRHRRLMGFLAGLGLATTSFGAGHAQTVSPQLISEEMVEIDSYVYPRIALLQQSGERLVVDALLVEKTGDDSIEGEWAPVTSSFSFNVPTSRQASRICVDISSAQIGLRKLSLMKLVKPVSTVTARIKFPGNIATGTVVVAYPTGAEMDDPQRACVSGEDWIYPIQGAETEQGISGAVLQLRVNTGGEDARIAQLGKEGIVFGDSQVCERSNDMSGLFNRICRLPLDPNDAEIRIQIVVAQRNAGSTRKEFNVSVGPE